MTPGNRTRLVPVPNPTGFTWKMRGMTKNLPPKQAFLFISYQQR